MKRWTRTLTTEVDAARVDAGWERVRARRSRPRTMRRALVAAPMVAFAALVVFAVHSFFAVVPPAPTVSGSAQLAPIALAGGAPLPASWTSHVALLVPLDDGSRLELTPEARVRTGQGAPDRVELVVESGRATFDVKPGGPRAWVVDAGSVIVHVLGTRFSVERDGEHVEVRVERGKVNVTTPEGVQILTAGQSFASPRAMAMATATDSPAATPEPVPAATQPALATPGSVARAMPPATTAPPSAAPTSRPAAGTTATAAASGVGSGAGAPADDPMLRADALRRAGRPLQAATVLRGVVEARDQRAPLAAFTLGKVVVDDLGDPAGGARWFERAIALGLPSGLDEEAHARAVECAARAGAHDDAARAAARYEARFPAGRHLARVKEWARD